MTFEPPKLVKTRNGLQQVWVATPTEEFWRAWRVNAEALRRQGYQPYKLPNGKWVVNCWRDPQQIEREGADAKSMRDLVAASYATSSDLEIPAPAGLSYLPYQRAGVAYALSRRSTLIADPMGLGKTIQAIGLMNMLPEAKRILVICPAALRLNWKREVEKWDVHGRLVGVATDFVPKTDVVVVNYDRLTKLHKALTGVLWDLVVLDEAHYLKNPSAARTKAVWGKEGIQAKRWLSLSGTPLLNRPAELWTHVQAYDPSGLGRSWLEYHTRYCNATQEYIGGRKVWNTSGASNLEELNLLLRARFMIRREKSEVLRDLPPKRRQLIAVDPKTETERKLVDRERAIVEQLEEKYGDLVEALREPTAQLLIHELAKLRHETALLKTSYVAEHVLDGINDAGKAVVFGWHKDVLESIATQIEAQLGRGSAVVLHGDHTTEERQAAVDAFQNSDNPRVIVASIKAMGVGFTLTRADWVVFAELSWTPADIEQAEDRLHRIGQQNAVLSQHIVYDGTTDAYIAKKVVGKEKILAEVLK